MNFAFSLLGFRKEKEEINSTAGLFYQYYEKHKTEFESIGKKEKITGGGPSSSYVRKMGEVWSSWEKRFFYLWDKCGLHRISR